MAVRTPTGTIQPSEEPVDRPTSIDAASGAWLAGAGGTATTDGDDGGAVGGLELLAEAGVVEVVAFGVFEADLTAAGVGGGGEVAAVGRPSALATDVALPFGHTSPAPGPTCRQRVPSTLMSVAA